MATDHAPAETRLTLGPDDEGRPLSGAEFAEADFLEPWRFERVDGRLIVMPPDGSGQVSAASPWLEALFGYKIQNPGRVRVVVPNCWVVLGDEIDRIGDIGVFVGMGDIPDIPRVAPELMFEVVSPGSKDRRRDYVEKRAEYERLGVREYVVVDRYRKTVTVHDLGPGGYSERTLTPADTYTSPLLPGLAIPLGEVLGW